MRRTVKRALWWLTAVAAVGLWWVVGRIGPPSPPGPAGPRATPRSRVAPAPSRPHPLPPRTGGTPARTGDSVGDRAANIPELAPGGRDAIAGEYVFSFFDLNDRDLFVELAREAGLEIIDVIEFGASVRVRADDREQLRQVLARAPWPMQNSRNYRVHRPGPLPTDPLPPETGYVAFGDRSLAWLGVTAGSEMRGQGVTVAVLDTRVLPHESLANTTVTHLDLLPDGTPVDGKSAGHGTAVASLIGGRSPQVNGLAPGADILSIRVLSGDGTGDTFTLANAVFEAVDRGAAVINLSLGTYGETYLLSEAIDYALDSGVVVVAAAGNDAVQGVMAPARYDGVLGVTAVDAAGQHLYFGNRGPEVDLAAPAAGVQAAGQEGAVLVSGTSAAAPFVSAAAAALISASEGMSGSEAADLLCLYANDAGAPGKDDVYGSGILDVGRLESRATAGIYDVTVCSPYLVQDAGTGSLTIYVQNRGTETLPVVDLKIEVAGRIEDVRLYELEVGESAGKQIDLGRLDPADGVQLSVVCSAETPGVQDCNPADNAPRTVTVVSPP